jgi:hypothetical protein
MTDPDRLAPDDFERATRAFEMFTLSEKARALEEFARLQDPSIADRFFEAVYRVIAAKERDTERTA